MFSLLRLEFVHLCGHMKSVASYFCEADNYTDNSTSMVMNSPPFLWLFWGVKVA